MKSLLIQPIILGYNKKVSSKIRSALKVKNSMCSPCNKVLKFSFCLEKVKDKEATKKGVESVPEDRPQNQIQQDATVHQHLFHLRVKNFSFLSPVQKPFQAKRVK